MRFPYFWPVISNQLVTLNVESDVRLALETEFQNLMIFEKSIKYYNTMYLFSEFNIIIYNSKFHYYLQIILSELNFVIL